MFEPNQEQLKKYADVLIKFALNSGFGVKKGEVVGLFVPDIAKPLLIELYKSVLEAGAYPIIRMLPTDMDKIGYEFSSDEQLKFFPKKYQKALVDTIDHQVGIIADTNLHELEGVDPKKILLSYKSRKQIREWMNTKEYAGKFTWTIALYPTDALAHEAGLSIEDFWSQIEKSCFLDEVDPIGKWKDIAKKQDIIRKKLDSLEIDYLEIKGTKIDLKVKIGKNRKWLGGGGRNIPSFEIFTSPDWRGTEGYIYFNQPLYMYGTKVRDIELWFEKGRVVKAKASRGQGLLLDMIRQKGADKLGEFSLTDKDFSKISKFMANTLFDENIGGEFGNMHVALGLAYKDALNSDPSKIKKSKWKELGFNDSVEHKDIINTLKKTVTAYCFDGKKRVIYKDGKFIL